jgi:DNA polymerase III sliding clamp (beta) subunit (PCNA family)
MISQQRSITIAVDRKQLVDACGVALLETDNTKHVPLKLEVNDNKMQVSAIAQTGSSMECSMDVTMTGAESFRIAVNPKYLQDALSAIEDDTVELICQDEKCPIIIKGSGYTEVVLPIKF